MEKIEMESIDMENIDKEKIEFEKQDDPNHSQPFSSPDFQPQPANPQRLAAIESSANRFAALPDLPAFLAGFAAFRDFLRPRRPHPITIDRICAVADDASRPARRPKNTKRTGELGEAAFLYACILRGLTVAKPWGDSSRFDFLVQAGRGSSRYHRVQVKCTESLSCFGYQVQSTYCDRKRKGKYTSRDIDYLVGYIIPLDLFYIVPIADCPASASLRFYPEGSPRHRAPFEHFREAWHLLRE